MSKCETAKHFEMPTQCQYSSHERCHECNRCYDCYGTNLKADKMTLRSERELTSSFPLCRNDAR